MVWKLWNDVYLQNASFHCVAGETMDTSTDCPLSFSSAPPFTTPPPPLASLVAAAASAAAVAVASLIGEIGAAGDLAGVASLDLTSPSLVAASVGAAPVSADGFEASPLTKTGAVVSTDAREATFE